MSVMRVMAGTILVSILLVPMPRSLRGQTLQQAEPPKQTPEAGQAGKPNPSPDEITAVPNRPTFASTAEMVSPGVFEIEYGFEAARGHQNINGLLKWGVVKNLELWFLNNPVERDAGTAGLGDSGAGFKYRVFPQTKILPRFSVLYFATIPTARAELGAGAMGHSVQLLASKDFGKHHIDINEGVELVGRPEASGFDRNYFSAFSYSHPIHEKWGYTAEIAGFSRTNETTPATMTLLGGITYNLRPRLVLDGGAYYAVYGQLPRITFFSGITYSVADLSRRHRNHAATRR